MPLRRRKEKYCLVLSGGGSKGVYHLGVWEALEELGIEVEAFIGNSIGAILAGFLAQGKTREMKAIGEKLNLDFIMKIPGEFIHEGAISIKKANLAAFQRFYHSIWEKKGIDISPLREMIYNTLDEAAIRKSGRDLGVVTFNLSDFKPQYKFLDEMEEGAVLDYLLASAAFPGLEQTVIHGKSYIDGGVVDNIPYKMARARGYRNIIVVDISGMGINRKTNIQGTKTIYIKNSVNMGWVFDFKPSFLEKYRKLGYLDAKKALGALKGEHYFIIPGGKYEKKFDRYMKSSGAKRILESYTFGNKDLSSEALLRKILPEEMRQSRDLLYCLADCAASSFNLDRFREYDLFDLVKVLKARKVREDEKIRELKQNLTPSGRAGLALKLELLYQEVRRPGGRKDSPYYEYVLCTDVLKWGAKILKKGLLFHHKELPAGLLAMDFLEDFL